MARTKTKSVSVDNKLNLKLKGIRFTSGELSYFLPLKLNNFEKWFADFVLPSILRSRYTKDSPEIHNILQVGDWNSVIGTLRFYYDEQLKYYSVLSEVSATLTYYFRGLKSRLSYGELKNFDIQDWLNYGGTYKYFDGEGFSEFTNYNSEDSDFFSYVMEHKDDYTDETRKSAVAVNDVVHLAMNKFLYTLYSFFSFSNESVQVKAVFEDEPLSTYFTYDNWNFEELLSSFGFETVAYVKTPTKELTYNLKTNPAHWGMLSRYNIYGLLSFFPVIWEGGEYTTDVASYTMNWSWGESTEDEDHGTLEDFFGWYSGYQYSKYDESGNYIGLSDLPFVKGLNLPTETYDELMQKSLNNTETVKNFVKQVGDIGETDHHVHLVPALKDVKISEDGKKLELWVDYDYVDTSDMFEFAEYITF